MSLEDIKARAEAATPGPWKWEGKSEESWPQAENSLVTAYTPEGDEYPESIVEAWGFDASGINIPTEADAEFIAHAREDVPRLVAALEAVEAWCSDQCVVNDDGAWVDADDIRAAIHAALAGDKAAG